MKLTRTLGAAGALIAAALIGGTLISTVFAAPQTEDASTDTGSSTLGGGEYCDVFLDAFAAELGVATEDLLPAGKAAANAALDAAVEAGDIDAERADMLRERIEAMDEVQCPFGGFRAGFGHGFGRGLGHGMVRFDTLEAAADALGLTSSELIARFGDEMSLQEVAEAEGVSYDEVKAAVLADVQADLDAAVADGLPQERADEILERVSEWLDNGGEPGFRLRFDRSES